MRTLAVESWQSNAFLKSSTIHGDAYGSRRIFSRRMRFCNQPEQGIDRWGIHGDAQPSKAMACSCCMALRIFLVLSLVLIKFCVIQTDTNTTSRLGAQNCALGVLFCAWIASGVVFAYAKCEKRYVGGRGGAIIPGFDHVFLFDFWQI